MPQAIETPKLKPLYSEKRGRKLPVSNDNGISLKREDNKIRLHDRAVHQWYRFVLSFPPHLVRDYISKFRLNAQHRVLDPFCGTGTTLVECKKLGIPSFGLESNPVVHFASQTQLRWDVAPQDLLDHAFPKAQVT